MRTGVIAVEAAMRDSGLVCWLKAPYSREALEFVVGE